MNPKPKKTTFACKAVRSSDLDFAEVMTTCLMSSILCLVLAFCPNAGAQTPGIIEERLFFPAVIDGDTYQLDTMVYRPNDNDRHPLVLFTHGNPGVANRGDPTLVSRSPDLCRALASEGLAVVFFVRKGYGNSEGTVTEFQNTAFLTGLEVAKNYRAALDYWRDQSFVMPDKVVLIGRSFSGWGVLAAATVPMDMGVKGVVDISGASTYALAPPTINGIRPQVVLDHWVTGAAEMGRDALLPSFWIQSENDLNVHSPTVRRMFEAYNEAGGWGFLLMLPPYGSNGHSIGGATNLYLPQLNDFLATIGIRVEALGAPSIVWTGSGVAFSYAGGSPAWNTGGGAFNAGDDVVLTVQLTANPLPTLQWQKNGVNLQNIPNKLAGVTSSALSIYNMQMADTGSYTLVATNSEGSAISSPIPLSLVVSPSQPTAPTPPSPGFFVFRSRRRRDSFNLVAGSIVCALYRAVDRGAESCGHRQYRLAHNLGFSGTGGDQTTQSCARIAMSAYPAPNIPVRS